MNEVVDLVSSDEEEDEAPKKFTLIVRGQPKPKPSPRFNWKFNGFTNRGKPKVQVWTRNELSVEMKVFREEARLQFEEQMKEQSPLPVYPKSASLEVKLWFCRRPPDNLFINKDRTRPKGHLLLSSQTLVPIALSICPDTDNMVKFALDALKSVAWHDDNQVGVLIAYKCYDCIAPYEGQTIVTVCTRNLVEKLPV